MSSVSLFADLPRIWDLSELSLGLEGKKKKETKKGKKSTNKKVKRKIKGHSFQKRNESSTRCFSKRSCHSWTKPKLEGFVRDLYFLFIVSIFTTKTAACLEAMIKHGVQRCIVVDGDGKGKKKGKKKKNNNNNNNKNKNDNNNKNKNKKKKGKKKKKKKDIDLCFPPFKGSE